MFSEAATRCLTPTVIIATDGEPPRNKWGPLRKHHGANELGPRQIMAKHGALPVLHCQPRRTFSALRPRSESRPAVTNLGTLNATFAGNKMSKQHRPPPTTKATFSTPTYTPKLLSTCKLPLSGFVPTAAGRHLWRTSAMEKCAAKKAKR